MESFDVIVVGAGIAGSACARFLAEGGRRVALVDRRSPASMGAHWVNGVPAHAFDDARIDRPKPPELRSAGHPFVVTSPSGAVQVRLASHDVMEVDMRHLGARLRNAARDAGCAIVSETSVDEVHVSGEGAARRPHAIVTKKGSMQAPLVVDASGLPAVVRRAVFPRWPEVAKEHVCLAAQSVHRITDDAGATRFLERWRATDGEVHARCGTHGGYSVVNVRVDRDVREVSLLTGAIAGVASGAAMIDELRRDEPWIGEPLFGGAGALPLRRPYARLVAPGLALLGDAGCQMFSAHGSGIAIGLRAARLLADVVLDAPREEAGNERVLWRYARDFHHRWGGVLAVYDRVRRATQSLTSDEAERLFEAGAMTVATTRAALSQELPTPSLEDAITMAQAMMRAPAVVAKVATAFASAPLLLGHAKLYPTSVDLRGLAWWEKAMAVMMGDGAGDEVE